MSFKRDLATAGALAILVVMAGAVPAQATVFEERTLSRSRRARMKTCAGSRSATTPSPADISATRTGKGELDQAPSARASYRYTDTYTNLATDASFSEEGRFTSMDVKATPLGGNIFEFRFRESGTAVIRDMAGDVVSREAGAVWLTIVFDTLGDSMPGGEVLDETLDRLSGQHPLFEDEAFCAVVHDLIG